jgi:glycosyltransferase involved in cell wall biosynthesis
VHLIIQIPCLNEEETLSITLDALPKRIDGVDRIGILIVDDGSTDDTVKVARQWGVDHVVSHPKNQGLAQAFKTGLQTALQLGADIIVNTDADNQYDANDIETLIRPILDNKADVVIGARPISETRHFSPVKKLLQKVGSGIVRLASQTEIADAPSGFRALSRNAAMRMNVFTPYTYTLETIIQAGIKNMRIISVPIRTNRDLRPSRLVSSIPAYVRRSVVTIFRVAIIYRPLRFFSIVGGVLFLAGVLIGVRFLFYFAAGEGDGHIQSLILAAILMLIGFNAGTLGIVSDLISVNRKLLEEIQSYLREERYERRARSRRNER